MGRSWIRQNPINLEQITSLGLDTRKRYYLTLLLAQSAEIRRKTWVTGPILFLDIVSPFSIPQSIITLFRCFTHSNAMYDASFRISPPANRYYLFINDQLDRPIFPRFLGNNLVIHPLVIRQKLQHNIPKPGGPTLKQPRPSCRHCDLHLHRANLLLSKHLPWQHAANGYGS